MDLSADFLAQGMLLAGCQYGVHLDMNPGLAGFEFYDVQPAKSWTPLGRKLQEDWEFEGTIREIPEFNFRARRMIKGMRHMNFPQYIQRDGRDFFYLTQRPVLPGAELPVLQGTANAPPREPGEGEWRVKGLPQHGFPYAMALSALRPDAQHLEVKVRALRIDPRAVVPAGSPGTTATTPTVVTFVAPRTAGTAKAERRAWFANGVFLVGANEPAPGVDHSALRADVPSDATTLADGVSLASPAAATARAAVGVQDEDGMLDWIELPPDTAPSALTAKLMDALLARAGCTSRMLVTGDSRALLGGTLDLAAQPFEAAVGATAARLVRDAAPGAELTFDTPVVAPAVWQPLQAQRVRYFRRPGKKAAAKASALPAFLYAAAGVSASEPPSQAASAPSTESPSPTTAESVPSAPPAPPRKPGATPPPRTPPAPH